MNSIIEIPTGLINGVNVIYTVSRPYVINTVGIYVNGLSIIREDSDGWIETNPGQGIITLKQPLIDGDTLQISFSYFDTSVETLAQTVLLYGEISMDLSLEGSISESIDLTTTIDKY